MCWCAGVLVCWPPLGRSAPSSSSYSSTLCSSLSRPPRSRYGKCAIHALTDLPPDWPESHTIRSSLDRIPVFEEVNTGARISGGGCAPAQSCCACIFRHALLQLICTLVGKGANRWDVGSQTKKSLQNTPTPFEYHPAVPLLPSIHNIILYSLVCTLPLLTPRPSPMPCHLLAGWISCKAAETICVGPGSHRRQHVSLVPACINARGSAWVYSRAGLCVHVAACACMATHVCVFMPRMRVAGLLHLSFACPG